MCLLISIDARHDERERLVRAAARASQHGLRVDVDQPSWWVWARTRSARAKLTEDGSCSCSLLADDADWNDVAWSFRAEVVPSLVAVLRTVLAEGPSVIRITATWFGEKPERVEEVTARQFLALFEGEGLGTNTAYVVKSIA
jgi:hypothetical protein